jgi:hypothetical protein
MTTWRYDYPNDDGGVTTVTKTEEEILDEFWDDWCKLMYAAGKDPEVHTFKDCINDWITSNWAWEVGNATDM